MNDRRRAILICVALAAATLATYWPVVRHQFINFDDLVYILQNPHVRAGLSWENVGWAFTSGYGANWHPLTWLSHMFDCQIFGLNAGGHHLTNLLFHTANSLLLFLAFRSMTGATWRSGLVAALFALHPLHVESVAWVAERKDVLSAFFFFLTLLAYANYVSRVARHTSAPAQRDDRGSRANEKPEARNPKSEIRWSAIAWYLLALLFFAFGLMSKPMLVTLPFVLLLLDYWPLQRLQAPGFLLGPPRQRDLRHRSASETDSPARVQGSTFLALVREKAPFFALSIISCIVTFLVQQHSGAVASTVHAPLSHRIPNALVSYVAYLGKMVWPTDLAMYYPPRAVMTVLITGGALLVLAILSVVAFALLRQRPWLAVGWLWYLGTLVPVIGFVQVGLQSMADRYTYIPLIGLFTAITWTAADAALFNSQFPKRLALAVSSLTILSLCVILTASQVRLWKDSETLYRHTLAVTGKNPVIHLNLGSALVQQGRTEEAADQFAEALRIEPHYAEALSDWGFVLVLQGKLDEGIAKYRQALALKPDLAQTDYDLGQALLAQGKRQEAIAEYRTALRLNPNWPPALNDLAWLMATDADPQARDGAEAIRLAERACQVTGFQNPLFIGTLAAAYAEAGRFEDAERAGEKARTLAEKAGQKAVAEKNRDLLEFYRMRKAYHEPLAPAANRKD